MFRNNKVEKAKRIELQLRINGTYDACRFDVDLSVEMEFVIVKWLVRLLFYAGVEKQ